MFGRGTKHSNIPEQKKNLANLQRRFEEEEKFRTIEQWDREGRNSSFPAKS